jgi:hypothetical protein
MDRGRPGRWDRRGHPAGAAAALSALGLSPWWSLLVLPVPALVVYVLLAKDRTGRLTETEKRRLAWNFRHRQPRALLGVAADTECTAFTWDVIVWTPPHPMRPTS